jgi:hypothetical protein
LSDDEDYGEEEEEAEPRVTAKERTRLEREAREAKAKVWSEAEVLRLENALLAYGRQVLTKGDG